MVIYPDGTVHGIRRRSTGVILILNFQSRDEDGVLVNEHFSTMYFPGVTIPEDLGSEAPAHLLDSEIRSSPPAAVVTQGTDLDQPRRYADASGDTGAYHLDEA